jgi:translation initiation factor IF-2
MTAKKTQTQQAYRPPVVALLGHVDHGKTTILDAIRRTSVAAHEVGGITQGISVYSVSYKNRDVTFIDTPGHEAFDLMRMRGGSVADIVLLIVAANDSVMPQTKESIQVIQTAKKPCIVVVNKVDIAGVDIQKVKRDLSAAGMVVESMGGDVPSVEISAKDNKGIDELLEMIQLVADVAGISPRKPRDGVCGEAMVLESSKDKSMGNVATLVVTAGEFTRAKYIGYFSQTGKKAVLEKVKGFVDDSGNPLEDIKEGFGAEIIGLSGSIPLGTIVYCIDDAKCDIDKTIEDEQRKTDSTEEVPETTSAETEEVGGADLLSMMLDAREVKQEEASALRVIIKAGTQGALDAILSSLEESRKDGLIEISGSGTGDITVNDVEHAMAVGAIVVGFRVQIDPVATEIASKNRVLAKVYEIIYELTDEIEDAAAALQLPNEKEEVLGSSKVKKIFTLSDGSRVIGSRVESGELKQGARCRVKRGETVVGEGKIASMRCEKDTVHSATKGGDCGLVLDMKEEVMEGDILECYRVVKS